MEDPWALSGSANRPEAPPLHQPTLTSLEGLIMEFPDQEAAANELREALLEERGSHSGEKLHPLLSKEGSPQLSLNGLLSWKAYLSALGRLP